jgi:hypothetical protein
MGEVIDFGRRRRRPPQRPAQAATPAGPRILRCHHCGERHPVVRLAGGEERCVTAFWDGSFWFCRNRGCRRAWLEAADARRSLTGDPTRGGGHSSGSSSRGGGRGKR